MTSSGPISNRTLTALQEITIEDNGKKLAIRSACNGVCGKVFQAACVAIPLTIRSPSWPLFKLRQEIRAGIRFGKSDSTDSFSASCLG